MIATPLNAFAKYRSVSRNLAAAVDWLAAGGWDKLPEGKHEISGTAVYALAQRYDSKPLAETRYETHRDYIDIQLLASGKELVEVRSPEGLSVTEPYKPDVEFYAPPEKGACHEMLLVPGTALVFFPEDAHRPGIAAGGKPEPIHKIVVKVAL